MLVRPGLEPAASRLTHQGLSNLANRVEVFDALLIIIVAVLLLCLSLWYLLDLSVYGQTDG